MSRSGAFAFALIAMSIGGCDAERVPPEDLNFDRRPTSDLPQALMLRFAEVKGEGSARESWEVEVLQMGGEVRVRGSVRTGGIAVPVYDVMQPEDYVEFWSWLRSFPVDRAQLVEDESFPETDWRKSLQVDVVLDEQTRWRSRNSWKRPLLGTPWVDRVETRLHDLALNLAYREVDREERDAMAPDAALETSRTAARLPGDVPDGLPDVD